MSLLHIGDLLAPEESYPHHTRVEPGGSLILGHDSGTTSFFDPPAMARRFVVRSACGAAVTAAARSSRWTVPLSGRLVPPSIG